MSTYLPRARFLDTDFPHLPDALCAKEGDPDEWFIESKGVVSEHALRICRACPELYACKEFAISNRIQHGIWGATSPTERQSTMRRRQRRRAKERVA